MMVKKKQKKTEVPEATESPEATREYEVGEWAGRAHYRCRLCAFDVVDSELNMLAHIQLKHRPRRVPRRAPSVFVADKRGNDVSDTVVDDEDGGLNGVFEVELKEVDSTIDEQGNEHRTYTIKE